MICGGRGAVVWRGRSRPALGEGQPRRPTPHGRGGEDLQRAARWNRALGFSVLAQGVEAGGRGGADRCTKGQASAGRCRQAADACGSEGTQPEGGVCRWRGGSALGSWGGGGAASTGRAPGRRDWAGRMTQAGLGCFTMRGTRSGRPVGWVIAASALADGRCRWLHREAVGRAARLID